MKLSDLVMLHSELDYTDNAHVLFLSDDPELGVVCVHGSFNKREKIARRIHAAWNACRGSREVSLHAGRLKSMAEALAAAEMKNIALAAEVARLKALTKEFGNVEGP